MINTFDCISSVEFINDIKKNKEKYNASQNKRNNRHREPRTL